MAVSVGSRQHGGMTCGHSAHLARLAGQRWTYVTSTGSVVLVNVIGH